MEVFDDFVVNDCDVVCVVWMCVIDVCSVMCGLVGMIDVRFVW